MSKRDPIFSTLVSKFKRLDFNEAFHEMEAALKRHSSANITRELGSQNSILHALAYDGDIEPEVFTRLAKTFDTVMLIEDRNKRQYTPIDILIREQKFAHLMSLSKHELINLATYTSQGDNALHLAASRDNPRFINFLIKQGADPLAANAHGLTPIDIARRFAAFSNVDALESFDCNKKSTSDEFYDLGLK